MCLRLSCTIGADGAEDILTLNLSSEEELKFRSSAEKLKATLPGTPIADTTGNMTAREGVCQYSL